MLSKQGVNLTFYAFYVDSTNLDGETSLTVTVDVYEATSGTPIVSGASATELGGGLYYYTLSSGSVDADAGYIAIFKTSSSDVVQKWLPAIWTVGTTLKAVDDVTNNVTAGLADDAITSAKFDESTAFPLASADTGSTQVARTGADSDTLETLSDQLDGQDPADVWGYATRTLTQSAASVTSAVSGSTLTVLRGDTFTGAITGLGDISSRSKLWFTVKEDKDDADTAAIIQIDEANGLLYLNGASATAGNGSISVDDENAGDITITIKPAATDDLNVTSGLYYDIQVLTSGGVVSTLTSGTCNITADVTRAIS